MDSEQDSTDSQVPAAERPLAVGARRYLLLGVGIVCSALALVGALLPVLPTTPFLLLAMACFVRTSPRLNQRLLANRAFGPYLEQWQHDRTVPSTAKLKAYGLVVVSFGLSIWFVDSNGLRYALAGIGVALIGFLAWLPVTKTE